ncbi:hypothetical protein FJO69_00025 [[Mycoplasma] falconis]|uniref:Uncharacterized protein n=1 Tax=[Mycoplasma] falconis TaxID=92403 RepID=A0A501XBQ6_9BACT|nr:hypothetical protein [[Mycoplasma] falconis]TPE57990.1 hypothetical protein FJO69_00025 [[Mycoplasma] falconis]
MKKNIFYFSLITLPISIISINSCEKTDNETIILDKILEKHYMEWKKIYHKNDIEDFAKKWLGNYKPETENEIKNFSKEITKDIEKELEKIYDNEQKLFFLRKMYSKTEELIEKIVDSEPLFKNYIQKIIDDVLWSKKVELNLQEEEKFIKIMFLYYLSFPILYSLEQKAEKQ